CGATRPFARFTAASGPIGFCQHRPGVGRSNGERTMKETQRVLRMKAAFGQRLRAARIVSGYERGSDFAKDIGIAEHTYRRYERGEVLPPVDVFFDICRLTKRSSDWLLFG